MNWLSPLNTFAGPIDLSKQELLNARIQNLAVAPATPVEGQIYYNTADKKYYGCTNATGPVWEVLNVSALGNDAVTNAMLANMTSFTLKGNATATSANPTDLSPTEVRTLLNVADGANAYSHPNHSGDVTSTGDGATVIGNGKVTNLKLATVPAYTVKGNNQVGTSAPSDLTMVQLKAILNYTKSDLGLSNVTNDVQIKKRSSSTPGNIPAWTDANGDAFDDGYAVDNMGVLTNDHLTLPTSGTVKDYVDSLLGANDAMVFKGTVGTGGTLALAAFNSLATYNAGWTYKVITAGTYRGNVCEIGDMLIATVDRAGTGAVNADWVVVQTNIDGAVVTSDLSPTTGEVAVFDGTTGKIIKGSGVTFDNVNEIAGNQVYDKISVTNGLVTAIRSRALTPASIAAAPASHTHAAYMQRYIETIAGGSTSEAVVHNLGTTDVIVEVYEAASPYAKVYPDIEHTSSTTITLKFATAPAAGQYKVVVIG